MNKKIPTIEEIYNIYHRETTFVMKGFYPRSIKNFSSILNDSNIQLLTKFQHFIEKNQNLVDWKLYIIALSKYFNRRFDLKLLGSLKGTKIYRQYLEFINTSNELTEEQIKNEIVSSLMFLKNYLSENEIRLNQYFNLDLNLIPIYLKHIYSGSVSQYFYACFSFEKIVKIFFNTPDDVFLELFNMQKNQFINMLQNKRNNILKYKNIRTIMEKIEQKI